MPITSPLKVLIIISSPRDSAAHNLPPIEVSTIQERIKQAISEHLSEYQPPHQTLHRVSHQSSYHSPHQSPYQALHQSPYHQYHQYEHHQYEQHYKSPGRIQLEWLDWASPQRIKGKISVFQPHIIFFIGHGSLQVEEYYLMIQDELHGNTDLASSAQATHIFASPGYIPDLLILNVCESAATFLMQKEQCGNGRRKDGQQKGGYRNNTCQNLALALVMDGFPMVIGMLNKVRQDESLINFSRAFFAEILASSSAEQALCAYRQSLLAERGEQAEALPIIYACSRQIQPTTDRSKAGYIPLAASPPNLSAVTFPDAIRQFAEQVSPQIWSKLKTKGCMFLEHITAGLNPIIQLVPPIPPIPATNSPVVGFECTAHGPGKSGEGEPFDQILLHLVSSADLSALSDQPNLPDLIRSLLLLAALKAVETFRSHSLKEHGSIARHLFFLIHLDPEILNSPYFIGLIDHYPQLFQQNILFGIEEDPGREMMDMIKRRQRIDNLRFALGHVTKFRNSTISTLKKQVDLAKLDVETFRREMDQMVDKPPQNIIRALKDYLLPGKPLIIEGTTGRDDIQFLQNYWPKSLPPLYAVRI